MSKKALEPGLGLERVVRRTWPGEVKFLLAVLS